MKTILVAGATGRLGRHVVGELKRRGHRVHALVRDPARLDGAGVAVDRVVRGDLARAESLRGACQGADVVFSCAGASMHLGGLRDRATFEEVDHHGNLRLLDEARRAGVRKWVYVSVFGGEALAHTRYAGAHERFVRALAASGTPYTVVRPTGFFGFFDEVLRMAAAGRGPVPGAGEARTNPIHEADLAEVCAAAVESAERELPVGGPEVYTRREIVEAAFQALGRAPRVTQVPGWVFRGAAALARPVNPRLHALLEFGAEVSRVDAVAPAYGTRTLRGYFREAAGRL